MNDELSNCPRCNGDPEVISHYIKGVANRIHHYVRCKECKYRERNEYRERGKAIQSWNNQNN